MNEPRRLRQGGGPSRRLLESASLDSPGLAARRRAALLSSTAGAFSRTARPATVGRSVGAAKLLLQWVGIGAAASAALGFFGSSLLGLWGVPATAPTTPGGATLAAPPVRATEITAELASPASHQPEPWVPTPPPGSGPASEIEALEGARRALGQGDAGRALTLLDAYARTYPNGSFSTEVAVLRVQLLHLEGDDERASALADALLRQQPQHPLRERRRAEGF